MGHVNNKMQIFQLFLRYYPLTETCKRTSYFDRTYFCRFWLDDDSFSHSYCYRDFWQMQVTPPLWPDIHVKHRENTLLDALRNLAVLVEVGIEVGLARVARTARESKIEIVVRAAEVLRIDVIFGGLGERHVVTAVLADAFLNFVETLQRNRFASFLLGSPPTRAYHDRRNGPASLFAGRGVRS